MKVALVEAQCRVWCVWSHMRGLGSKLELAVRRKLHAIFSSSIIASIMSIEAS
ncbi:hypothetical protein MAXJ12_33099 [Mesorhizobium alhagi CCNWXJ12-2]|uniref:Uncharacterized protein n=1 Tax=Mesorhizobium alhagi CCNWXJ12-2 TaxID=1107882 RepID=H0I2C0_9HYPH|nr:hypothetical protein MAXJ12_33099 [Mesorhizobium alhagi CCNWXJ12-2]